MITCYSDDVMYNSMYHQDYLIQKVSFISLDMRDHWKFILIGTLTQPSAKTTAEKNPQLHVGGYNQERKCYLSVLSNKVRTRKQFPLQTDIQWDRLLDKIV